MLIKIKHLELVIIDTVEIQMVIKVFGVILKIKIKDGKNFLKQCRIIMFMIKSLTGKTRTPLNLLIEDKNVKFF